MNNELRLYKLRLIVVLFVLFAASCSDEGSGRLPGQHPVTFTASVGGEKHAPVSRAYGSTWMAGDKVGIHKTVSGSLGDEGFVRHTIQEDLETLIPDDTDETFYYPVDESDVKFIAFYPYPEETIISEENTVTFELTDQSTREKQETIDFLYYKDDTKSYNSSTYAVDLDFDHKLSRIVLNIINKDSGEGEPADITLSINGFPTTVVCSLADGSAAAGTEAGNITPWQSQDAETGKTYEAIVAPHEATGTFADRLFTITVGTSTFYYKPNQTLEPGYSYIYNFTVSGVIIDFEGITITDWNHVTEEEEGLRTLSISDNERTFLRDAATDALGIKTNTDNPPTVTSSDDWLTITSVEGADGVYTANYELEENTDGGPRTTTITVTEGTMTRSCRVHQKNYDIPAHGIVASANCIVLQTGGEMAFIPITIVNEPATYPGVPEGGDTYVKPFADESNVRFDAKVLWVDSPNFATASLKTTTSTDIIEEVGTIYSTLADSYLCVKPGIYQGNAVVCITKPGTDDIIWSWHIWVLSPEDRATMWIKGSKENTTYLNKPTPTANGYAFLPLNLGAFDAAGATTTFSDSEGWSGHPYIGLYYQWGRKDPLPNRQQPSFMGSGLGKLPYVDVSALTFNVGIGYDRLNSIQHPYNFPFNDKWYGTIIDNEDNTFNNSWGYVNSVYSNKSPFDPCPAGWRVPGMWADAGSNAEFNTTYHSLKGCNMINCGGFYPSNGRRTSGIAFKWIDGDGGSYQNASTAEYNDIVTYSLYFNLLESRMYWNFTSRTDAQSVRCVTE